VTYIRFFADTAGVVGGAALCYLRSIVRIAPVRLVSMSAHFDVGWDSVIGLLTTPMTGEMIANVVCTEPDHWSNRLSLPMPKTKSSPAGIAERDVELYTNGTRNVLIATGIPRSKGQCEAAAKYERIAVPTFELADKMFGATGKQPVVVAYPVVDHAALRVMITK
jgi:hypothetical protein